MFETLPPGTKLKRIRRKFKIVGNIEKKAFIKHWRKKIGTVLNANDVDQAVSKLETVIHTHMDKCMSLSLYISSWS